MTAKVYFRNPSAHWCFVQGFCIILHVDENRYISVPAEIMERLLPHINSPTDIEINGGARQMPSELLPIATELATAQILTYQHHPHTLTPNLELPRPATLISQFCSTRRASDLAPFLLRFLIACTFADFQLRKLSLRTILSGIASRRALTSNRNATALPTATLASIFTDLRPLYPRRYRCMFDSLALLHFLAYSRIFPRWVFGVSADPFFAHCWVQEHDVVLCDTRDFSARTLVPLMTV